ncbi:hypothetical protein [Xanthomonas axonopodis]|uniref:hypothetical protein n=1 Tax=Xanthomonas axonopodis TaxID=53413 RepID=UPI0011170B1B|nr:hypothetical protein [Xanthomonas axonopodis]
MGENKYGYYDRWLRICVFRIGSLFVIPLFFSYLNYLKFIPPADASVDIVFSIVCITVVVVFLMLLRASMSGKLQEQFEQRGLGGCLYRWSMRAVLIGFVGWALAARLVPWSYTEIFGYGYSESVLMRPLARPDSLVCSHALMVDPMPRGAPARLCVLGGEFSDFPNGTVTAVIQGKRSFFGSTVDSYHWDNL